MSPPQERDRAEAELEQVTLECNQLRELVDELESRVAGHEDDLARVADEWQAEVTDREQQLEEALERVKAAERELADKDADVVGTNKDLKAVRSSVISDDGFAPPADGLHAVPALQSADHIWELEQLNEQLKLDKQKLIDELTTADAQLSDAEQIEKRLKQVSGEMIEC
jgi:predicted RNase H-like nuclease (RuvC/YqgF family)